MRRVVGLTLAGLGAFLVVGAVLLPTYVTGQVVKFPLNEYEGATLKGTGVSYFSPVKLRELTGVTMRATYTIKGDGAAGSSSTAVWNEFSYLYDETNAQTYQYQTRKFAFDRRTGQLVDCCGANLNGNSSIRQTGLVGYVWPIGTQKKTYDVFDTVLNKPMPFRYEGTATTVGIPTYLFVESVPPTQAGSVTLPGSLVGMKQASVTLPEMYTGTIKYWVDPTTGALLNVNEYEKLTLDNTARTHQLALLYNADLAVTPTSLSAIVKLDSSGRSELSLLTTVLPLTLGIVGFVALIAGIVLRRVRREDNQPESADITAPEPVLDPAPNPPQEAQKAQKAREAQEQAPTAQFPAAVAQDAAPSAQAPAPAPSAQAPAPSVQEPAPPAQDPAPAVHQDPATPAQDPATTA
jgi:hypothetical protein